MERQNDAFMWVINNFEVICKRTTFRDTSIADQIIRKFGFDYPTASKIAQSACLYKHIWGYR